MAKRPVVLLVEDDTNLRSSFRRTLKSLGCEVREARNPYEAIPLLDEGLRPAFILSDLQMPQMDGDAFCAVVRETYPNIPFVLMSGSMNVYARGHAAGATHTFSKPIHRETFEALILEFGGRSSAHGTNHR